MNHDLLDWVADSCNPVFLLVFLLALYVKMGHGKPARVFLIRFLVALFLTYIFSHVHQWFHLWPEHGDFVSGHMTFLLTVATSFFLLDRRSLAFSIPFVIGYGVLIMVLGYHQLGDLLFALGIAVPVTLASHHIRFRKCFGEPGDRL